VAPGVTVGSLSLDSLPIEDQRVEAMVSDSQLRKLADFPSASWALWSGEFPGANCLESRSNLESDPKRIYSFVRQNARRLKPGVVFLGLNRSSGRPLPPFRNFHGMHHRGDKTLHRYVQDEGLTGLQGAFMTDVSEKCTLPDSHRVKLTPNDVREFAKQLQILAQPSYKIICFGRRAFSLTVSGLVGCDRQRIKTIQQEIRTVSAQVENMSLTIFGAYHYSPRGFNNQKVLDLRRQLSYLNSHEIGV
jgi:hypothetical protein